ncbi:bifunctional ligase/repressor BirA [Erysipelotrichaceae bacterium]|nr:bifunctional ligase/repressor BirA [Erysipelotrichaceae bacterium]
METKQKILMILEEMDGVAITGTKLGEQLGISRNAIWKQINGLIQEGHSITAIKNRGYLLIQDSNALSKSKISSFLTDPLVGEKIEIYEQLASTNQLAKLKASGGASENTVIIANMQTAGRGKMGKKFFSPADTGIYLSLIIRPKMTIYESTLLTAAAAVAVCSAIEKITGKIAEIKWVNDIFVEGKKVAGILTEAQTDFENGVVEYIVIGVGINLSTADSDFPLELAKIAGSIQSILPTNRNQLIAELINQLLASLSNFEHREFIPIYQKKSFLTGKKITVEQFEDSFDAIVIGIDANCRLIVETEKGLQVLHSGDVKIRRF